jgi:hypothetical protein
MAETYLFDGVDIQISGLVYIADWDGSQFSVPDVRGTDLTIPSHDGVEPVERPFGTSVFTIPLELIASGLAQRNDTIDALLAIIKPGQVTTCTRRRTYTSGDVDVTARVRYLSGFEPGFIVKEAARHAVSFTNLDGVWRPASASTPTIPATITVGGTAKTNKITLVLPGAGTLTNTTLGVSVTVTAGATLTVATKTTTGTLSDVVAAGDPRGDWFKLKPGSNAITWSGAGTPTISYYAAYL